MTEDVPGVAIVGMAALFPGAPDLEAYRANLRAGVDAITAVPPDRWDPVFFDPEADALDRFYGDKGGFVDPWAWFDPLDHGVVPTTVTQAEPDQLLVLRLAVDALHDAGIALADLPRETTGVFLGRGGYITSGLARSAQKVREGEQVVAVLRQVLPDLPEADVQRVKAAFRDAAGDLAPDQAIGLVPNLAASRTANRLDLRGPAMTFDAACASALVAVDHAVAELRSGRLDAALVGGVHLCHDPTFWSIFCRLGAMSRAGSIRPFDADADGLLVGEGAGVVLLKRAADAVRDGDRIYAVIRGTGVASDGRGATLMSPSSPGQALAVRRAWQDAGLDPRSVGLVEAHGTATAAGDAAELQTLAEVFGSADDAPACVGSVKSMIGHTMPAAGIAGLIKAALAVHEGVWLPTLHVDTPHPELARTRFRTVDHTVPWPASATPRRAGVNAFGFGGINAHVVLEQSPSSPTRAAAAAPRPVIALYGAADPEALAEAVRRDHRSAEAGPARLALLDPTPDRRERAALLVARGKPWHGRKGMWFAPEPTQGKVAFLFPGVEEAFDARLSDVAHALGLELPEVLQQPPAELTDLGLRGTQILASSRVAHAALRALGIRADVFAGHSIGEWSALIAAGTIPEHDLDGFIDSLADETLKLPDVVFGVLGTGATAALEAAKGHPDVALSHDNCPHQSIVCGPEAAVRDVLARTRALGEVLPFRSGFHSPHFAPFQPRFAPHIARVTLGTSRLPVWSSCTVAPYPAEGDGVRAILTDLLVKPVRFRETLEALYDDGVRVFVQVGAGSLPHFVSDTLGDRHHVVLSTADRKRTPLEQVAFLAGALWAEGRAVQVRKLPALRGARGIRLRLGAPLVTLTDPPRLSTPTASAPTPTDTSRLGQTAHASLEAILAAQREVMTALAQGPQRPARPAVFGPRERTWTRRLSVESDPYLLDHCLFHQPDDLTDATVRYPVVPMTMNIQMMIDAAAELVPERVVIGLDKVRAWRWLVVAPPVEITLEARFDGVDAVEVRIPGFAEAVVRLGERYPAPPAPTPLQLHDEQPLTVPVSAIYPDRWMFHGPTYQGIVDLGPTGSNGILGAIVAPSAPGSLLDNAGQVYGFWGFERLEVDSLGFPARIERIRFHGPMPAEGTRLDVRAWLHEVRDNAFKGDIELEQDGRVWCRLEGWQNRRFETDAVLMPFLRLPGVHSLAELDDDGVAWVRERWHTTASRELLIRRYLDADGITEYEAVPPWEQRRWVLRRVTAVDATRAWLWGQGHGPLFPIEVAVHEVEGGFVATGPFEGPVYVAVALGERHGAARLSREALPEAPDLEMAVVEAPEPDEVRP